MKVSPSPAAKWPPRVVGEYCASIDPIIDSDPVRIGGSNVDRGRELWEKTVHAIYANVGEMDLAESRFDHANTFYSNFTPPGKGPSLKSVERCPRFAALSSFCSFVMCAIEHVFLQPDSMIMGASGVLATMACSHKMLDWRASYVDKPLFVGIVFPVVFLIAQTWARREKAVERVALLRANAVQLCIRVLASDPVDGPSRAISVVDVVFELMWVIANFLPQTCQGSGTRLTRIYHLVFELQRIPECQMLSRFMLAEFEKLRVLRDYRTPWSLNYFCFVSGFFAPILCAPLFAGMDCPRRHEEGCEWGSPGGYISVVAFSFIMCSLLRVVRDLEDPFDVQGYDDVLVDFTMERHALLAMIEEVAPGTLKTMTECPLGATERAELRARDRNRSRDASPDRQQSTDAPMASTTQLAHLLAPLPPPPGPPPPERSWNSRGHESPRLPRKKDRQYEAGTLNDSEDDDHGVFGDQ